MNHLEENLAGILGKDDAMYVPTGTRANQVALRVHTKPGDVVITLGAGDITRTGQELLEVLRR